ncbi:hypothetical protein GL981_00480 [Spiroplasma citri]|uniref:Transmembrane protein n=1 Tax=Spiroplasma citri TaxID=2133 RepID=A0AAJ4JXJ6_SPICI|nr:hypothetical protein [Spiroplasma citri]QIA68157.1 hypothetical protein GL298_00480 [Spiroplasma citri]QIA70034.1 hypothetical protein GL981_00480 [Spiroplasma citri]QJU61907.1 hypothetical protein HHA36_05780 [Spiroplasma citri]
MKKLLSFLAIFSFLCTNTVNLISCGNIANNKAHLYPNLENVLKVNLETNIDLEKRYLPHPVLMQQRGYKGTFFNQYKTDTIKNLTNAFLGKANTNLAIKFKTEFSTYQQLQDYLKIEQQNYWQNLLNNICQQYQDNLKQLILLFYNFVASIWNKTNINEILGKIEIKNIIDSDNNVLGQTNNHQTILLNKKVLSCAFEKTINSEWHKGQFTTNNFLHILIHELGHIFYFYDWETFKINHIFYLKQFLGHKINNLNKFSELDKEKVLKIFANSNYGLSDDDELLAEGFAYWLLTKQSMQTKIWEFWNEYFTSYLPQIRDKERKCKWC